MGDLMVHRKFDSGECDSSLQCVRPHRRSIMVSSPDLNRRAGAQGFGRPVVSGSELARLALPAGL